LAALNGNPSSTPSLQAASSGATGGTKDIVKVGASEPHKREKAKRPASQSDAGVDGRKKSKSDGTVGRRKSKRGKKSSDLDGGGVSKAPSEVDPDDTASEIPPGKKRITNERYKLDRGKTIFNDAVLLQEKAVPLTQLMEMLLSSQIRRVLMPFEYGIVFMHMMLPGKCRPPEIYIRRVNNSTAVQLVVEPCGTFRVQTGFESGVMRDNTKLNAPRFLKRLHLNHRLLPNDKHSIGLLISRFRDALTWCRGLPAPDSHGKDERQHCDLTLDYSY
jgi:hypothetical protein